MDKLVDKIYELEGYRLQCELYEESKKEIQFNTFEFKFTVRKCEDEEII